MLLIEFESETDSVEVDYKNIKGFIVLYFRIKLIVLSDRKVTKTH